MQPKKLTRESVLKLLELGASGASIGSLARQFSISRPTAKAILKGDAWPYMHEASRLRAEIAQLHGWSGGRKI